MKKRERGVRCEKSLTNHTEIIQVNGYNDLHFAARDLWLGHFSRVTARPPQKTNTSAGRSWQARARIGYLCSLGKKAFLASQSEMSVFRIYLAQMTREQ